MTQNSSQPKPVRVRVIKSMIRPTSPERKSEPEKKVEPVVAPKNIEVKKEEPKQHREQTPEFVKPKEKKKLLNLTPYREVIVRFISKNKIFLGISAVLLVLIVATAQFVLPQVLYRSNIPSFLPKDTLAFGALSINPLNAEVRSLASDLQQSSQNLDVTRIINEVNVTSENSFQNLNIAKVVTQEAGFAVFNSDDGISKVLILHIPNPKDAQALLENISKDQNLEQKDYKGSNIFTIRDKVIPTKAQSYLYSHEYVFIATGATATFNVADVIHRDQPSLKTHEGYRKLVSASRAQALGRVYLDSSKASQLQGVITFPSSLLNLSAFLDDEPLYVSLYEKQGALAYDVTYKRDYENNNELSGQLLSQNLPKTTFVSFEGKNFSQDWQDFKEVLTNSEPLLAFYFSNIQKRLQDSFEFNFESDFLKYFQSNYALALDQTTSRSKNTGKPFQNVGVMLHLENTERFMEAEPDLETKVKNILSSQFQNQPVNLTEEQYAGLNLKVFSGDGMPVNIYFVVDGDFLYVSSAKSFFDTIKNPDQGTLGGLAAYQKLEKQNSKNTLHAIFVNNTNIGFDLVSENIQKITDGMLVRDTQKGDNAVITGYIHFLAKQ